MTYTLQPPETTTKIVVTHKNVYNTSTLFFQVIWKKNSLYTLVNLKKKLDFLICSTVLIHSIYKRFHYSINKNKSKNYVSCTTLKCWSSFDLVLWHINHCW